MRYSALFEWLEAAHWRGYTNEQFAELGGDEQALIVAQYRTHFQIDAVLHEDAERRARRAAKARSGTSG